MDGVIQQIHAKVFDKETVKHMDRAIQLIQYGLPLPSCNTRRPSSRKDNGFPLVSAQKSINLLQYFRML